MKLCLLIVIFFQSIAFANVVEPSNLQEHRNRLLVRPFLGQYVKERGEEVTVVYEYGELVLWYVCDTIMCSSFSMPMDSVNQKVFSIEDGSKGKYHLEKEFKIVGDIASRRVVQTGRFWKSIEEESLQINGTVLVNKHSLTYFKRKYIIAGDWVVDKTSFDGIHNSFEKTMNLPKLSSVPMPFDMLSDIVSKREPQYITLSLNGEPMNGDLLREMLNSGSFVWNDDGSISPAPKASDDSCEKKLEHSAEILPFRKKQ